MTPLGPPGAPAPGAAGQAERPAGHGGRRDAVTDAARQFEGLIIGQLLRGALGGDSDAPLFGKGPGAGVYEGFLETYLSDHLARAGGLGLARTLAAQLGGETAGPKPGASP